MLGHAFGLDGTDEVSITQALVDCRRRIPEYEAYYRQFVPGYENATLQFTAPSLGVRETRRILGDYVLSVEDFKKQAVFEDEIGRYAYPVDLHSSRPCRERESNALFQTLRYHNPGESYGVPYRCLLPCSLVNVLTAGRCVSTDRYMQGSLPMCSLVVILQDRLPVQPLPWQHSETGVLATSPFRIFRKLYGNSVHFCQTSKKGALNENRKTSRHLHCSKSLQ